MDCAVLRRGSAFISDEHRQCAATGQFACAYLGLTFAAFVRTKYLKLEGEADLRFLRLE